jgi:hypothetical protein
MRMVTELSDELHEQFKTKTGREGVQMAGLVREWVAKYVSGRNPVQNVQIQAPKSAEPPANAVEAQLKRDEILRRSRKGK